MPTLKSDKIVKSLKSKGFTKEQGDHVYLEFHLDGKFILHTKVSHGSNHDLGPNLVSLMSKQCQLSKKQFMDLVNCPLSADEYVDVLREKGVLD
jgi:predicted RNA binding protein YcfA (HicA-like mRNA interferase family)